MYRHLDPEFPLKFPRNRKTILNPSYGNWFSFSIAGPAMLPPQCGGGGVLNSFGLQDVFQAYSSLFMAILIAMCVKKPESPI